MNLKNLRAIRNIVGSKNRTKLPILDCIHLESDYLYMSDLSITVKVRHFFPVFNPPIIIDFDNFYKRMSTIKAPFSIIAEEGIEKVMFVMPEGRNSEMGTMNNWDSFILCLPKSEDEKKLFSLSYGEIRYMNIARGFAADDELRPVMQAVCMSQEYIVASDAHKLYFRNINRKKHDADVMIDRRVIKLMMLAGDDFEIYHITRDFYRAESAEMTIWYRTETPATLYAGNSSHYPNWRSILPKDPASEITVPVNELLDAMKALEFAVHPASGCIKFVLKGNTLELHAKNLDEGIKSSEIVRVINDKNASVEYGMKLQFCRDIFKVLKDEGRYQVSMKFTEVTRCFVFADYILLMPMMLTNYTDW